MRTLALLLALLCAPPASAFIGPDEVLDDPALEARARGITAELRCVVCQGQALDESNATIARDLRLVVREQVVAGRTDAEIFAFLSDRYGEFVLYRPPFTMANAPLWLAAPLLLLAGGGIALMFVRKSRATGAPERPPLTPEEQARLARLLEDQPR
jgi:cytochrome c-type biogenesis protein CcmH